MMHLIIEYNAHNDYVTFSPIDIGIYTLTTKPYQEKRAHYQSNSHALWMVHFHGAYSRQGNGVGVALIYP